MSTQGPWSARLATATESIVTTPHRLVGLALLRVLLGASGVWYYVSDVGRRDELWGPHGIVSADLARARLIPGQFSLYLVTDSTAWFQFVFFAGLLVAVLFTIFGGSWLCAAHAIFMLSLYWRNTVIMDGGDNLAAILLLFLPLAITNAYLSPGSAARRRPATARPRYRTLVHNTGLALILVQVTVVYVTAGLWKLASPLWRAGQALYYVSSDPEFNTMPWYHSLVSVPWVGATVCWWTILIELAFPLALVARSAVVREAEVFSLEGLHLGIAMFMGLAPFGLIMIAADCTGLPDGDYHALRHRVSAVIGRTRSPSPARAARPLHPANPP